MIDRHQRRALPARRHIGRAQVIGDVDAHVAGEERAVADLHGQAPVGPVQHGLAVEADDVDGGGLDALADEKFADNFDVAPRDQLFRRRQRSGPVVAPGKIFRGVHGAAQQAAIRVRKRIGGGGAEFERLAAIGLEIGEVDPVHRRARHCANGAEYFRHCKPRRENRTLS